MDGMSNLLADLELVIEREKIALFIPSPVPTANNAGGRH